jgi:hypothetical protein
MKDLLPVVIALAVVIVLVLGGAVFVALNGLPS